MRFRFLWLGIAVSILIAGWNITRAAKPAHVDFDTLATVPSVPAGDEVITFGAGCFWHVGAVFQQIPGVASVTAGYLSDTNGTRSEATRVVFDPKQISLEKLLQVFWLTHRPTVAYSSTARAAIYYETDTQRSIAEKSKRELAAKTSSPILTEVTRAGTFSPASEYDQNYYAKQGATSCGLFALPDLKELGLR